MAADRPQPPMVLVEWEDATNVPTWEAYEEAAKFEDSDTEYRCTSVGYLIRDDEECVVVASRATVDFKQVGLFERIPRGMVRKITHLRRK